MEIKQAVAALSALAQESRLDVFRRLVRCGVDGMAAGDIAGELDVPPTTLSFHLKELANAGLIVRRREGRRIIYTLNINGMRELISYLTEDCCEGRPELCQSDYSDACCDGAKTKKRRGRKATATK